jgi:hypothetical protein
MTATRLIQAFIEDHIDDYYEWCGRAHLNPGLDSTQFVYIEVNSSEFDEYCSNHNDPEREEREDR